MNAAGFTPTVMATASEVAHWMVDLVMAQGHAYHEELVGELENHFGSEWSCVNENGTRAVDPKVLQAFRKLHGGSIEWHRAERSWSVA
jgi:hypothetical protein